MKNFREKISATMKEKWEDPEFREKQYRNNPVLRGDLTGERNPMYGKDLSGENNPMYGKKHTEDTLSLLRRPKSAETRSKMSKSKIGRVWIHRGQESKLVYKEDLVDYPDWTLGRPR